MLRITESEICYENGHRYKIFFDQVLGSGAQAACGPKLYCAHGERSSSSSIPR